MPSPAAQSLLSHCPEPLRSELERWPDLEVRIDEIWTQIGEAWPSIQVAPEDFFAYLGERLAGEGSPSQSLDALDAVSLYLACGCAAGISEAISAFKAILVPYARSIARRMGLSDGDADDLTSTLCETLLVAGEDHKPRITQYSGRGNMRSWLKVSTTRLAMRKSRKERRSNELEDDAALEASADSEDLVLAYLRQQYREPFKLAFREAFRVLPLEDRLLLRRKFVDELTGDELAKLYNVHRATVVRHLGRARQMLVDQIRTILVQRTRVSDNDVDSLIRVLRSQLDASLSYLLGISTDGE